MRARAKDVAVSALLLVVGRRKRPRLRRGEHERIVPEQPPDAGGELLAIALLAASALCAIAFVAFYALDRLPNQTQLLGGALGLCFCFLAAALIDREAHRRQRADRARVPARGASARAGDGRPDRRGVGRPADAPPALQARALRR